MIGKKGQPKGSSAGTLVGIITLIIIFYILFLPPTERAELLGEDVSGGGTATGGTTPITAPIVQKGTIFSKNIGRLDISQIVPDKAMPNVIVSQTTNMQTLASPPDAYIKNGVFDKKFRNITFTIRDIENTDNIYLAFDAVKRKGILTIKLNGETIYEYAMTKPTAEPIRLEKSMLSSSNILSFEVSGVGYMFWTTNEYNIENIKIIGEVTDVTQQKSRNTFTLSESEYGNIETATLKFIPYCQLSEGVLTVSVNSKNIFSSTPICGDPYFIPISPRTLSAGDNNVAFQTSKGRYSVEQILLAIKSKPTKSLVYYFEMDKKAFTGYEEVVSEARCGEIDGYCPANCDEDLDKDCCFANSKNNYWCDIKTEDLDDRCAAPIDAAKCQRCASGYEDSKGEPATACEGRCGDDTDGICASGCSKNNDKDCCFAENEENYWCNDLPTSGIDSTCEAALSSGECDDCSTGYRTESGATAECESGISVVVEEKDVLREEYKAMLYVEFVDDALDKRCDINVNGHITRIDQSRPYYSRDISLWVRPDNNYIEIYPITTLNIVKVEVRLE